MERTEILEKLKEIIISANEEKKDIILAANEETTLAGQLGLSSFMMLYTAVAVEETFNIRFEPNSYKSFLRVKDLVDFIEKSMGK